MNQHQHSEEKVATADGKPIEAYALTDVMEKLVVEEGIVLLRPRGKLSGVMSKSWRQTVNYLNKAMRGKATFIILPHNCDVFVVENKQIDPVDGTDSVPSTEQVNGN